jgi:hypothetical protein
VRNPSACFRDSLTAVPCTWAAADGYQVAPYDEAELARLRAKGIFDPEDDPTVVVSAPATQPRLFFQLVPDSTTTGFPAT